MDRSPDQDLSRAQTWISAWNSRDLERILSRDATNERAFLRLKQILTTREKWRDLEALYERVITATEDLGRRAELLGEVALIAEEITGDHGRLEVEQNSGPRSQCVGNERVVGRPPRLPGSLDHLAGEDRQKPQGQPTTIEVEVLMQWSLITAGQQRGHGTLATHFSGELGQLGQLGKSHAIGRLVTLPIERQFERSQPQFGAVDESSSLGQIGALNHCGELDDIEIEPFEAVGQREFDQFTLSSRETQCRRAQTPKHANPRSG